MKKIVFLAAMSALLAACSPLTKSTQSAATSTPVVETEPTSTTDQGPILDSNVHNLLITEHNFSVDEVNATQGDTLILSIRNQLKDPINVVIDELGVKSKNIPFGELEEVHIPTDRPGEYEMYSSLGNQRKEGFSATVIIDPKLEDTNE